MAMRYKTWFEKYKPLTYENPNDITDVILFDTCGEDLEFLNKQNPKCIWTEVSRWTKSGKSRIISGAHLVNRVCYYVTEIPFEDEYLEVSFPKGYDD